MKFDKVKICLITDEQQRFYYTDYQSSDGFVLLEDGKTTLIVDSRYLYEAHQVLDGKGVEVIEGSSLDVLKDKLSALGANAVGIDYSVTTLTQLEYFKKALGEDVHFENIAKEIADDMIIKSDEELSRIAKACEIAQRAYHETVELLHVGMSEREVANELEYRFKKYGASGKSFDTIVGFGANSAVPHHETGDDTLKEGDVVLMDFGCVYKGYCSDMTRTCVFGKASDEFRQSYKAVLEAHKNAFNIVDGMTGVEADALARDVLKSYGLDKYFTHSLGHGIGLHIHELPNLSPRSPYIIGNGMVYSNEPGVYYDGKFGIRIEDSCYMKDGITHSFMYDDKELVELQVK